MNINLYETEKENVVLYNSKTILSNDTIDSLNIENFENCEKNVPIKNIYFVSLLHDLAINDKSFNDSLYHYTKNHNIRLHIFKENSREFFKTLGIVKFDDLANYGIFHTIDSNFFDDVEKAKQFFSFDDKLNTFNVLKAPVKVVEKRKYIASPKKEYIEIPKIVIPKIKLSNTSTNLVITAFDDLLSSSDFEVINIESFDYGKYSKLKNIYLFLDTINNFYTNKMYKYCLENEINLYTVLPIKSNFENCLFEGITAKDLMNNKLFTIHIVNDKNKFIHKYWIKAAKEYIYEYEKITFDSPYIPDNICDYELVKTNYNPNNNNLVVFNKAATGIGKNRASKNQFANFYKDLGYSILVCVPTNAITKEQSEMITYIDKNGIEKKKPKYTTFTAETKAISKARLKRAVNVENKGIPYNLAISNQDTFAETYFFLTNELNQKVVIFIDEGHTLPRYSSFKHKDIDSILDIIDIAPKTIIQSATPFIIPFFDSINIEFESTTKTAYNQSELILIKKDLQVTFNIKRILENEKKGIKSWLFMDSVDSLKQVRSVLEKSHNLKSILCASDKIDKHDTDKMNTMLESGRFEWNKDEPTILLSTQILEAGVNVYIDAPFNIIYGNRLNIGFDVRSDLQGKARIRNHNDFKGTYTILSNETVNPNTNEFQINKLNYDFEYNEALEQCEFLNKQLSLRRKMNYQFKEYSNKFLKEMNISFDDTDSENPIYKVSRALILSKMYKSEIKSSSPYMSDIGNIQKFELDDTTNTVQSLVDIERLKQKDTEKTNLKRVAIFLNNYFFETFNYVSENTDDKFLRDNCSSDKGKYQYDYDIDIPKKFKEMFETEIDYLFNYELEKFVSDYLYLNLRLQRKELYNLSTLGYLSNISEIRVLSQYERKEQTKFIIDSFLLANRPVKLDKDRQEQLTDLENIIINTDLYKLQNTKINNTDKSVLEEFADRINSMQPIKLSVSDLASIKDYLRLIDLFEGVDGAKTAKELLQIANLDKRKKQYKQKYLVDSLRFIFDITIDDSRKPYKYTINSINDFKKNLE